MYISLKEEFRQEFVNTYTCEIEYLEVYKLYITCNPLISFRKQHKEKDGEEKETFFEQAYPDLFIAFLPN